MHRKTRQLSIFNFFKGELLAIINGSYEERKKWMKKYSLKHLTAMSRAKRGSHERSVTCENQDTRGWCEKVGSQKKEKRKIKGNSEAD